MKNKRQLTQVERVMRASDFIVTKADKKGRITYANTVFVEFSGYTQEQLIGAQHNIVRHPEMPRGVFHLLWQTIASGQEFHGYIKNMAKDGSYYWVFANVTPSYDQNHNIIGYFSVRRKPSEQALKTIQPLYQQMKHIENTSSAKEAVSASTHFLQEHLKQQGMGYEQFVLSL